MDAQEARRVLAVIRGNWRRIFLDDDSSQAWMFALKDCTIDEAMKAVAAMKRVETHPRHPAEPSLPLFEQIIYGDRQRRFKCPRCGLGWPTEERMREHVHNVHD